MHVPAHRPNVSVPPLPEAPAYVPLAPLAPAGGAAQTMAPAPPLPPILEVEEATGATQRPRMARPAPAARRTVQPQAPAAAALNVAAPQHTIEPGPLAQIFGRLSEHHSQVSRLHQDFVAQQSEVHQRFLSMRQSTTDQLLTLYGQGPAELPAAPRTVAKRPEAAAAAAPPLPAPKPRATPRPTPTQAAPAPPASAPAAAAAPAKMAGESSPDHKRRAADETSIALPSGMQLSRAQLEIHSSGRISEIFGPLFEKQDGFARQVRMPEPPLLLADRMVGLEAEAGSMAKGTLWSETDVRDESWYLHQGRMPAGIMIESGQADLMLISYLGIDFLNQGERVYRLLGCELTWHEHLPKPGETLQYEIHVDGHARQGDVRLFFFHYDCRINGAPRLSVRQGQAGFFSAEELDDSKGILWTAEDGERCEDPQLDPPITLTQKQHFSRADLEAFARGDIHGCFGPGFEKAKVHTLSPRISGGRMLFLDEVTHFDPAGGPWGRGYLRAIDTIEPDDWFFEGHFKNDPCMPGTLMFEGCLQAMAFYMTAFGFTLDKDGWRFEPIPDQPYKMSCRGQVKPTSRELVYEVFIEEVIDGPEPMVYADLLCTVDGLGAFHCRRMGLRLTAGWPRDCRPDLETAPAPSQQVASVDGLVLDYNAMLACAWDRPSMAFGPNYAVFDGPKRVARLPGPPYHFMSRVQSIEGEPWAMKPGVVVEIAYDIPPNAWYFRENAAATMPFCVLLEAALQPCGWLASLVGSALSTDRELGFRNLDGTGTLHVELLPTSGTLLTRTRITKISSSAGMIIEGFEVECFLGETLVYTMETVFGFFPPEALAAQKGLAIGEADKATIEAEGEIVDLTSRPPRFFEGGARLPEPMLLMIDRVTGRWPEGGAAGLGLYRAEKDVDPGEWFFEAHFYQDPVQPGSLGIEAMIQLLQFAMLDKKMDEGMVAPRFEPLSLGAPLTWKYRGQVLVHNETISSTLEITEEGRDERGPYAVCKASLWVDGMRIYEASGLGVRIVEGHLTPHRRTVLYDPDAEPWIRDHCPTFTVPALPMMSMVDAMASAATDEGRLVVGLRDVRVSRWATVSGPSEIEVKLSGGVRAPKVSLLDEDGMLASATVLTEMVRVAGPAPLAALDAPEVEDPYASGALFHGPAFQALESLRLGPEGASAVLDASPGDVPPGTLNPRLLDAATHAIPHDNLRLWSDEIPEDMVAYPALITALDLHTDTPLEGKVRCEVRFDGFFGSKSFPAFAVQLICGDQVWASFRLVEALFPKGPLGKAHPADRRAFLRDRRHVPAVGLSTTDAQGVTTLDPRVVAASDWLPGTVAALYGTTDPAQILRREHLGRLLGVHPSRAEAASPLNTFPLSVSEVDGLLVGREGGPPTFDISTIKAFWGKWFGIEAWPVADLYYALIERFVGRIVLADPEGFAKLKGRSCLYVANHQVGVESLLFSIIASGLTQVPAVTLAKAEHRQTWLGELIAHSFTYPGASDPEVIAFFDREDRGSLQKIIAGLAAQMAGPGKGVMVHVEGTRSLSCRAPVEKMSGAFIDMALEVGAPIVPVRFVGGLPAAPLDERIEFPIGMGKQDYWLGAPIWPQTLGALPYGERKREVIDAINNLGPSNTEEVKNQGDIEFEDAATNWSAAKSVSIEHAVLRQVLLESSQKCDETRQLLEAQRWTDLEGDWMQELGRRLLGDKP